MAISVHCAHDKIVPLSKLKPHPGNPNKHPTEQIALLAKVIAAQGWRNPIVVSNRSGLITKGHARREAALSLKCATVPVDYQDYASEKEELADMIADNRIAELAEADRSMLRELAEQLDDGAFDMDLTGFDHDALEELMTAAPPDSDIDAEPQIDKAEELRVKWGVERGQIWELGEHRIMCGDSTSIDAALLTNGENHSAIVADPPYGMRLDADFSKMVNKLKFAREKGVKSGRKYKQVEGDEKDFDATPVIKAFNNPDEQFWFGADYYADSLPNPQHTGAWMVWDKRLEESADRMFGSCFELIWSRQKRKRDILRIKWAGIFGTEHEPQRGRQHPNQKPVALLTALLQRIETPNIIDPFCGSGTTIIACEQLGRKCRAMEIDPSYVAVSIQRWADATGKTPRLLNGK